MARTTDTERGARIAQAQASAVLQAATLRNDLFPLRLNRHQLRLWQEILVAAECELEDALQLRLVLQGEARA